MNRARRWWSANRRTRLPFESRKLRRNSFRSPNRSTDRAPREFCRCLHLKLSHRPQSMNLPIEASIETMISPFEPGEPTPQSPGVDSFLELVSPLDKAPPGPAVELSLPSDFFRYYGLRE